MAAVEWYIREYRCDNGICFKTKFPVRVSESVRKAYSIRRTEIRRAEKGATEAKHEAARLLNCNFRAGRDFYLGLDYSDEGLERLRQEAGRRGRRPLQNPDEEGGTSRTPSPTENDRDFLYHAAEHEAGLFIRRVQRECKKQGVELRYLYVTSDLDGHTFEDVRVHHHMVVNAEAVEICLQKWYCGGTWAKKLRARSYGDLTELAEYMIGQVRYFKGAKRYTPSRNLKRPVARKPVKARDPEAELAVPRGCKKIWRGEYYHGRPQHLRYYRPPDDPLREDEDWSGGDAA